jgi:hypothetical protein
MAVQPQPQRFAARPSAIPADALSVGLALLAAYHLGLALFMAVAPHAFFTEIGPFGARNDHYVRDVATFSAAIGVGLAISVARPAWRVPMLTVALVQFALHSVNHLVDIGDAHPAWEGYFDFFGIAAATLLIAWMLRAALARRPRAAARRGRGGLL